MNNPEDRLEDRLRLKIRSLDQDPPQMSWDQEALWDEIQRQQTGKSRSWRPLVLRIAASLTILIVAALIFYTQTYQNEELSYSVESTEVFSEEEPDLAWMEADAMEFIDHNCLEALIVCSKPEFKALKADLGSLQADIDQLDEMIEKYGEDPVIIKSRTQIEDLKNEITNRLVQMVLS